MTARYLKVASIACLAIAVAPQSARAADPFTITLMVPVQMTELPGNLKSVRVHCSVHAPHGTIHLRSNDFGEVAVVNDAASGTATIALYLIPDDPIPAGTLWTYECHAEFVSNALDATGGNILLTPGIGSAQLAPSSGPNLVSGTFTTQ